jgi:hypothetical protein
LSGPNHSQIRCGGHLTAISFSSIEDLDAALPKTAFDREGCLSRG